MDRNGFSDPYVILQLGKQRFRTKVVKKCLNPSWSKSQFLEVSVPLISPYTVLYTLLPKNKKARNKDCGEILLTICFSQSNVLDLQAVGDHVPLLRKYADTGVESPSWSCSVPIGFPSPMRLEKPQAQTFAG